MKTSRHLTETPGARERTSDFGDGKPETLARGASNFQASTGLRTPNPVIKMITCNHFDYEIFFQRSPLSETLSTLDKI